METNTQTLLEKPAEFLKSYGIRPSFHRMAILDYLNKNRTHPSVEMIYKDISSRIPTLSKTTIYNTLSLFVEKGIAIGITIEENELRYDICTIPHIHFRCKKCGKIIDFDVEISLQCFKKEFIEGNKIDDRYIYLAGVCKECLDGAAEQ